MKPVKIGIIGLGNIGCGVMDILQRNSGLLTSRMGAPIEVARAVDIEPDRPRSVKIPAEIITTDAMDVINDPGVQIVVELIGGIEPARSYILAAIANGKHVVTANKALLSTHWLEITEKAAEKGVTVGFEGSVAGGIPLIRTIKIGLVANRILSVTGIINGTCNYILTRMHKERMTFSQVLGEAQSEGFAEADPAMDVEGIDAAQKLAILVNLCFNVPVSPDDFPHRGISRLVPLDLEMAEDFGCRVKLIATARRTNGTVEAWVHPSLVPIGHPLASVDGVFNAVYLQDDNLGPSLYYGRGAGALPTGSAVVADIVSCVRDIRSGAVERVPVSGYRRVKNGEPPLKLADDTASEFYVRVSAHDSPGVLSTISGILGKNGISIGSVIQRGRETGHGGGVPLVMITHEASFSRMLKAFEEIDSLKVTMGDSFLMRILQEG